MLAMWYCFILKIIIQSCSKIRMETQAEPSGTEEGPPPLPPGRGLALWEGRGLLLRRDDLELYNREEHSEDNTRKGEEVRKNRQTAGVMGWIMVLQNVYAAVLSPMPQMSLRLQTGPMKR